MRPFRRVFEGSEPVSEERQAAAEILKERSSTIPLMTRQLEAYVVKSTTLTVKEGGEERLWVELPPEVVFIEGVIQLLPPTSQEEVDQRERAVQEFKERQETLIAESVWHPDSPNYDPSQDPDRWHPEAERLMNEYVDHELTGEVHCEHHGASHPIEVRVTGVTREEVDGRVWYELAIQTLDGEPFCGAAVVSQGKVYPMWVNELTPGSTPFLGEDEENGLEFELSSEGPQKFTKMEF